MACIYKINGKTFNTTEEIQNYVSSDEFVSVLAKGSSGISKEVRNLILNKNEKTNEVREIENGQGQTKNEGIKSKGKNDGQKTNDVQNEEVTEGGVKAPEVKKGSGVGGDKTANIEQAREKLKEKYGVYLGGEFENHHTVDWNNKTQKWEIVSQSAKYNEDKGYREFEQKTITRSDAKNREDALKELEAYAKEKGITLYDGSNSLRTEATAFTKENREKFDAELKAVEQSLLLKEQTNTKENAIQKPSTNEEVSRNGETRKNQPESSQGVRQGEQGQEATEKEITTVAEKASITPKNAKDLYKVNRELFGLNKVQALASAITMDRMVGAMAKRAGITKTEMYGRLKFEKTNEDELKKLSKKGKLLKQIVGENAKLSQDIKNNLQVARDMEAAGKNPKEIRISTGWEKGVDNKWRYEITDPSLNVSSFEELNDLLNSGQKTMGGFINIPLSKLMNNLQFGDDYRNELSNVSVLFDNSVPIGQAYYQNGAIHINPYSAKYNENYSTERAFDNFKSIILHEVQHHIQQNEGFAMPFSEEGYKFEINYEIENAQEELDNAIRISEWEPSYKDRIKPLQDKLESLKDKKKNISEENLDKMYWLSSGEVESRNVQARMNMTPIQKRETLLSETEDVAKDEQIVLFQKDAEKARGAMMIAKDGKAIIYAITDPNVSTPLHELAHVFEHYLTDAEKLAVKNWAGTKQWDVQTSEKFARGFEKYLAEGKAPNSALEKVFANFKEWLTEIYNGIVGSDIDIELNDDMRELYSKMLGEDFSTQKQEATPQVKEANVKAIEEAMTKKSGTIKNEIIKEAANPTEVKKILDNLDAIKSKLAGFKTKDGDRIFSEECKWG